MSHPQPRLQPHPLALFSLIPLDKKTAEGIVDHPDNRHLVSFVPGAENHVNPEEEGRARGLNIGFQIGSKSSYTLATIGRCGDITVEGSSVSRIQCSFEIHEDTKEIFLYDRSSSWTTQTFGENAVPFERDRVPRRVVMAKKKANNYFGFGGVGCNLFQFQIYWHERPSNLQEQIVSREDHPRFTRTINDQIPTALASKRTTRIHTPAIHTPGNQGPAKIRYYTKEKLGKGSFGEVWKAVDADSGKLFALKLVEWPKQGIQSHGYTMLKREVEIFARMSHPNIVEFIAAQGFGETHLEIFTALREGNIENLIEKELFLKETKWAEVLLRQMLQALDYLASEGIVHRDVKPANILYQSLSGSGYTFQLTDFGLCNCIAAAQTIAGSPIFMAPEFHSGSQQTSKVDVWSLFVTLAYAMNASGFRKKRFDTPALRVRAAQEAANDDRFQPIRAMAIVDPEERASAADMLDAHFKGEGRSTPRDQNQIQSAPEVERNAPAPRKAQTHKIQKIVAKKIIAQKNVAQGNAAQKRRGQVLEGFVQRKMPGAFQDDVVETVEKVQEQP